MWMGYNIYHIWTAIEPIYTPINIIKKTIKETALNELLLVLL